MAGFGSVGEAIIALRRRGLSREQIAERLGTSRDAVTNRINVLRRAGRWPDGLDTAPGVTGRPVKNASRGELVRKAYRLRRE